MYSILWISFVKQRTKTYKCIRQYTKYQKLKSSTQKYSTRKAMVLRIKK